MAKKSSLKNEESVWKATQVPAPSASLADIFNKPEPVSFTGIARSIVCFNTHNQWRNFKIATLHIKDGIVQKIDYSDPYTQWEAASRLDVANDISLIQLNNKWKDGAVLGTAKDPIIYWENREK